MLSTLLVNSQKMVFFVDNIGVECKPNRTIKKFLEEQGQLNYRVFEIPENFNFNKSTKDNIAEWHFEGTERVNVILSPLNEILIRYSPEAVFHFINKLKNNKNIKQIFLWATTKNIYQQFVIPFIEYMSDVIVTINDQNLSILTRKSGGLVTNKLYTYNISQQQFYVQEIKRIVQKPSEPAINPETLGTFKINLEEEELVARNALKLPYERTEDSTGSNIIYTPDDNDDFDEEDPDEDLYI